MNNKLKKTHGRPMYDVQELW